MKIDAASTREPVIVMERMFDAPRELVWEAFTTPAHVAVWYGGHGFANPTCEMDVRPGGRWRHVMRTPDGVDHPLEFEFLEVVRPEKLSWRSAVPAPRTLPGPHDPVMTVTLEAAGAKTKFKLVARFSTIAERDAALGIGFTRMICEGADKLNDLLSTR